MASHLKGVAKSTMSDQIHKELCEYKRDNPASTQKDLQRWLEGKFKLKVSQGTISNTFLARRNQINLILLPLFSQKICQKNYPGIDLSYTIKCNIILLRCYDEQNRKCTVLPM